MEDHNSQRQIRCEKLKALRDRGINPYPHRFAYTHHAAEVLAQGDALLEQGTKIALAGRLVALRRQGKAGFAHIKDNHTRIQCYVRLDAVGEHMFQLFKLLDLGDYVGLWGAMMRTKSGELTVRVSSLELLAKALLPLPIPKVETREGEVVVHDAIKDVEFRYRQRYVDLALNDEVADVFRRRSLIVQTVRDYLLEQGYLEVETPILQVLPGGAAARPFTTRHQALDISLYLRIATELYLKRLVVGGLDRVFEIGKDFRNEGIDRSHNPEFTMVEFYQAYADYEDMMIHFEAIWERCALAVHGDTRFSYQGTVLDVKRPWKRITMLEALRSIGGVDFEAMSDEAVECLLAERGWRMEGGYNRGLAMAVLFEELCEGELIQPTFVTDFPRETSPLSKAHRQHPHLVERFEPYVVGYEVGNAYSELNDPQIQKSLLEAQAVLKAQGDVQAHPYDADFIRAMEYGMPPMGGVGLGIDRMVMMLTDQHSIRDVLLFPTMRPEQGGA